MVDICPSLRTDGGPPRRIALVRCHNNVFRKELDAEIGEDLCLDVLHNSCNFLDGRKAGFHYLTAILPEIAAPEMDGDKLNK